MSGGNREHDAPGKRAMRPAATAPERSLRKAIAVRLWWLLAWASFITGIVGIFVPGLPTTVFILIAAYAAARGSQRLRDRLLAHPRFGPAIRNWERHGAISRRGKRAATLAMVACAIVLLAVMAWFPAHRWWMTALPIACMALVAAWIWSRPEGDAQA